MSDAHCRYCGPLAEVEVDEHLASAEHRQIVELALELDARTFLPQGIDQG